MASPTYKHFLVIVGLIILAALLLAVFDDIAVMDEDEVGFALPDEVGGFAGIDIVFCRNEPCQASFELEQLEDRNACPTCGGEVSDSSLAESRILPADTRVLRKRYRNVSRREMDVSIVLSGTEQKSIHRPQQCLPAQGHVIEESRAVTVPIDGRAPLKIMLLDLRRSGKTLTGRQYTHTSAYAYWFVGGERETPYHSRRLLWMSADRILHGRNHRWACIAVATDRKENSGEHIKRLKSFIARLYPETTAK